jgi:hypothetical protein
MQEHTTCRGTEENDLVEFVRDIHVEVREESPEHSIHIGQSISRCDRFRLKFQCHAGLIL